MNTSDTDRLLALLREIEMHCPCGARPETPNTHPHVVGCPVVEAIRIADQKFMNTSDTGEHGDYLRRLYDRADAAAVHAAEIEREESRSCKKCGERLKEPTERGVCGSCADENINGVNSQVSEPLRSALNDFAKVRGAHGITRITIMFMTILFAISMGITFAFIVVMFLESKV